MDKIFTLRLESEQDRSDQRPTTLHALKYLGKCNFKFCSLYFLKVKKKTSEKTSHRTRSLKIPQLKEESKSQECSIVKRKFNTIIVKYNYKIKNSINEVNNRIRAFFLYSILILNVLAKTWTIIP